MGIHRINEFFVEEFGSPGDLRFRIETDIRIPRTPEDRGFLRACGTRSNPPGTRRCGIFCWRVWNGRSRSGARIGDGSDSSAADGDRRAQ